MKSTKIIVGAFVASLLASSAYAGEWADLCVATLEAEGRDSSGCQCLEDAVGDNASLIEEFTALAEIADEAERFSSASDDAKAAMQQCTR